MAETVIAAVWSPFAWPLFKNLFNYCAEEINNNRNHVENFIRLEDTVLEAQKLVACLSLLQFQHQHTKFQHTIEAFTNLCYDAEDFVNKVRESKNRKSWRSTFSFSKQVRRTKELLLKIRDQWNELENLKEEVEGTLNLEELKNNCDNQFFTGRKNEIRQIKQDLFSHRSENRGVSILGRRGLGKTALAWAIFEDTQISEKFTRVWIDVDGDFNLKTAKGKLANVDSEQHLLIILDNLLNITPLDWMDFWVSIKSKRSVKVLITTLNPDVSRSTVTKPCYLNPLPDHVCKELIVQSVRLYQPSLTSNFLKIQLNDDVLVTRCEGLPLLAKIVGHRLATLKPAKWPNLPEIWEWDDFKDIFPRLKRSYKDMPPRLIKCFAYFSLFPHNHEFRIAPHEIENHSDIDNLFQLWESEGFLTPQENSSTSENIFEKHLNRLLERSLLQCDESGKVYKLQRFNQKIAEVASSKTCLRLDDAVPTSLPKNTRHLSLLRENFEFLEVSKKGELKRLQTILSVNDRIWTGVELKLPIAIFKKISSLRVLSLNGFNIHYLPLGIGSLIHLRHLDVSRTPIRSLPDELATLLNLRILKLNKTSDLLELPNNFHQLTNLQCLGLDINDIYRLCPLNIGKLSKLRALPLFVVVNEEGRSIRELQNMDHLQGSICIQNLENVQSKTDAKEAMLYNKNLLTTIELEWNKKQAGFVAAEVLEGLKPRDGLSKLKITRFNGNSFPAWISNPTLKLRELHLYKCYCNSLPALGQLKALVLEGMSNLIRVEDLAGSYLSLEFLEINDMDELQRWTMMELQHNNMPHLLHLRFIDCPKINDFSSLKNFGSLEILEIKRCPELETLPDLPESLESLVIENSDKLKRNYEVGSARWEEISWIPSVLIDYQDIRSTPCDQRHQNDQVGKVVLSTMDMGPDQTIIGKGKGHTEITNNEFSDVSASNNGDDGRGQLKRKGPSNNSSPSTSKVEKNENDQVAKVVLSTIDTGAEQTIIGKGKGLTEKTNNEFSDVSASNNDDDGHGQLKKKGPSSNSSLSTSKVEKNENGQVAKVISSIMDISADQNIIGKGKGQAEITNNEFSDISASNNDDDGLGQLKKMGPSNNLCPSTSKGEKNENDQICFKA